MPSVVDLVNTALAHLGDVANVQSISPPDGSAQAVHCARFYPTVRDSLLEAHDWAFSTRRIALAELNAPNNQWQYAYAAPADMICARKVLDVNAPDDWSAAFPREFDQCGYDTLGRSNEGIYTPRPFVVESLDDGSLVIFTNQENAQLQYTVRVTDPTKFSPLFCDALCYLLASKIAGPIIKGSEGRAVAKEMFAMGKVFMDQATASDANQRRTTIAQSTPWIVRR